MGVSMHTTVESSTGITTNEGVFLTPVLPEPKARGICKISQAIFPSCPRWHRHLDALRCSSFSQLCVFWFVEKGCVGDTVIDLPAGCCERVIGGHTHVASTHKLNYAPKNHTGTQHSTIITKKRLTSDPGLYLHFAEGTVFKSQLNRRRM